MNLAAIQSVKAQNDKEGKPPHQVAVLIHMNGVCAGCKEAVTGI